MADARIEVRQTRTDGMVELTLLEVHVDVDDSEFSAAADAYAPGEKDVEAGSTPPGGDDDGSGRAAVGAVVGLVFAVVVAYAARRQFSTGNGDGGDDGGG